MHRTALLARMTMTLGVMVLIALAFSVLALNDIAQGESDLNLEWAALRVTALLIVMFVGLSMATIRIALRKGAFDRMDHLSDGD